MSDLMLDVDQAGELKAAFRRGDWTNALIKRACEGDLLAQFKLVVEGSATIVPAATKEEIPVNTIIHVDRSVRPTYPNWMKKVMHPELESTGLAEYDIASAVSLWLHDKQKNGVVTGQVIYDYLKTNNMLESCGNLQDALAIQKLGVAAFKKAFGNNVVYFWKSVVQNHDGNLNVPYLYVDGEKVALNWNWLDNDWNSNKPAVRFATHFIPLLKLFRRVLFWKAVRSSPRAFCRFHQFSSTRRYIFCYPVTLFPTGSSGVFLGYPFFEWPGEHRAVFRCAPRNSRSLSPR